MSTEVLVQTLTAGQKGTFGAGTMFLIAQASGNLNIVARTIGNSNKNRVFSNVPAGFKFTADTPDDGFDVLEVTSPGGDTVTIAVGTDDVTFAQISTVVNVVSTQDKPAAALNDGAPVVCTANTQAALIASNLLRRRVTVSGDPNNGVTVFLRKTAGTHDLLPVAPGAVVEIRGTYGLDYNNQNGAGVTPTLYLFEEQ